MSIRLSVLDPQCNMIVPLIPFFLAAHVAVNETQWTNGPRYLFDVKADMSVFEESSKKCSCAIVTSELICSPRESDSLACRHQKAKIIHFDAVDADCNNITKAKSQADEKDFEMDIGTFQVRFNERGIENYIVPKDTKRWKLDITKAILNQLHVGFQLNSKDVVDHRTRENFTIGDCEVKVDVSVHPTKEEKTNDLGGVISFVNQKGTGETTEIWKIRNTEKCNKSMPYFIGNYLDYGEDTVDKKLQVKYSVSFMAISPKNFTSYTESNGLMTLPTRRKTFSVYDKVTLSLRSIQGSTDKLEDVASPTSTGIFVYSTV